MKKSLLPIIVLTLTLAFLLVSFIVYITRGENSYFLKKKLRIGAMLLGFTFMAIGCDKPVTYCYNTKYNGPNDSFVLDSAKEHTLTFKLENKIDITGIINDRSQFDYSYAITDTNTHVLQIENIYALDGAFDETNEEFKIYISSLPIGKYYLSFYWVNKDQLLQNSPADIYTLIITE